MVGAPRLSYAQLLETNNLLQTFTDETYWLCVTRTVQESKLFPVPPYMLLSYLNAFYRYPSLLRKVESVMSAEEIGDRAREGRPPGKSAMGWGMPGFYLLGREWLINMGLLRPQDAAEDVVYLMDFWKRLQLSWHRNDGHITNKEFGHRCQILAGAAASGVRVRRLRLRGRRSAARRCHAVHGVCGAVRLPGELREPHQPS